MTSDHSTLLSDIADEANALLGGAPLHRGDLRWLTGRLVHVLISPVEPSGVETAVSLTLATTDGRLGGLGGLAVDVTDADGTTRRAILDDDGHALLLPTTDSYRLAVEAPVEATPAVTPAIETSDPLPLPLPSRVAVRAGRRPRYRPGGRRPAPVRAAAMWALPAAVVLLFAAVLVAVPDTPALAVEVRELTDGCPPPAAELQGRDGHVEVAATWGGPEQERFREVLERFSNQTRIRVTLSNDKPSKGDGKEEPPADRDLKKTLLSRIGKGCSPGVALLPQTGLLRHLATEGHLFPIEGKTKKPVRSNYSSAWTELGSVDGELYGVWFKASDKSLIWYNVAAFERAGVGPPVDWEGLKQAAGKLKAAGVTPFAVAGAEKDAWTLTDWFENVYLRTAGRTKYEQLAAGTIPWTDKSVEIALGKLAEIFGEPEWLAGSPDESLRTSFPDSVKKVFANPKDPEAAMVFEGDFVATEVAKTPSELGVDARSFPFPSIVAANAPTLVGGIETGEATGGDVAVLLRNGGDPKDPDAEELLRYLATPEAAEPWIRAGGFLSPNKKAEGYPNRAAESAAADLANAKSLSFDLSDQLPPAFGGTPGKGMWLVLQDFLRNPDDVEGTARRLQTEREAAK